MNNIGLFVIIFLITCVVISGCSSQKYPSYYQITNTTITPHSGMVGVYSGWYDIKITIKNIADEPKVIKIISINIYDANNNFICNSWAAGTTLQPRQILTFYPTNCYGDVSKSIKDPEITITEFR
jgi:hypothetical protein